MEKIIAQGAEAKIILTKDNTIKKIRIKKNYRIPQIDDRLIRSRNKREIKVYKRLPIPHPELIGSGEDYIVIEYIDGDILKDVFNLDHCKKIGEYIALMHDSDIIHGDLTTSNMILRDEEICFIDTKSQKDSGISEKCEIFFIDFGLSFFSKKIEDRAVDLYLFYRAIESKHYEIAKEAFDIILQGYKRSKDYDKTLERLEEVKKRGKNKH